MGTFVKLKKYMAYGSLIKPGITEFLNSFKGTLSENPLKVRENVFYFTLKAFFVLTIFTLLLVV